MIAETDLRLNIDYIFYYVNWGQNIVTGVIPLLSLFILNYLVYKNLKGRRGEAYDLGNHIFCQYFKYYM